MSKTLLYRLFGIGKLPAQLRATLEDEGIIQLDEGIASSITYLDFHAPGKRFGWRKQSFTGAIAVTQKRIVGLQNSQMAINVPFTDERIHQMKFSIEGEETLDVAFDASLFHNDWSGRIEYRFRTAEVNAILATLNQKQAGEKSS